MVLQVEESCSALDVGQGFGAGHFLPLEYLPGAEGPLELPDEFFQVVLYHAIQGHKVAIDVVEHFDGMMGDDMGCKTFSDLRLSC